MSSVFSFFRVGQSYSALLPSSPLAGVHTEKSPASIPFSGSYANGGLEDEVTAQRYDQGLWSPEKERLSLAFDDKSDDATVEFQRTPSHWTSSSPNIKWDSTDGPRKAKCDGVRGELSGMPQSHQRSFPSSNFYNTSQSSYTKDNLWPGSAANWCATAGAALVQTGQCVSAVASRATTAVIATDGPSQARSTGDKQFFEPAKHHRAATYNGKYPDGYVDKKDTWAGYVNGLAARFTSPKSTKAKLQ